MTSLVFGAAQRLRVTHQTFKDVQEKTTRQCEMIGIRSNRALLPLEPFRAKT